MKHEKFQKSIVMNVPNMVSSKSLSLLWFITYKFNDCHNYPGKCLCSTVEAVQYSGGCQVWWRASISTAEAVQYGGGLTVGI